MANKSTKILYIGDNLPIMLGMESEMVDLIYTDPPFKTETFRKGKTDAHSFDDTWSEATIDYSHAIYLKHKYPAMWDCIVAAEHLHSPAMHAYLLFMASRIAQMHRLLKPTGSLYLHCDPNANAYLRILLDCVFGNKNFRNEIVWQKYKGIKNNAKGKFSTATDSIFFYVKTADALFNMQYQKMTNKYVNAEYKYTDEKGRRYAKLRGRMYQQTGKTKLKYLDENPGTPFTSLWTGVNLNTSSNERTGYDTQKPLALLDRIIKASSNEGDLILDPFCGCATACMAAAGLRRQWIGIDQNEEAVNILRDRFVQRMDTADFETNHPADAKLQKPIAEPKREVTGYKKIAIPKAKLHLLQQDYGKGQGCFCRGCFHKFAEEQLEVDHILAKDKGGLDELENLQLLCRQCNGKKGSKDMEFLYRRLDDETRQRRVHL